METKQKLTVGERERAFDILISPLKRSTIDIIDQLNNGLEEIYVTRKTILQELNKSQSPENKYLSEQTRKSVDELLNSRAISGAMLNSKQRQSDNEYFQLTDVGNRLLSYWDDLGNSTPPPALTITGSAELVSDLQELDVIIKSYIKDDKLYTAIIKLKDTVERTRNGLNSLIRSKQRMLRDYGQSASVDQTDVDSLRKWQSDFQSNEGVIKSNLEKSMLIWHTIYANDTKEQVLDLLLTSFERSSINYKESESDRDELELILEFIDRTFGTYGTRPKELSNRIDILIKLNDTVSSAINKLSEHEPTLAEHRQILMSYVDEVTKMDATLYGMFNPINHFTNDTFEEKQEEAFVGDEQYHEKAPLTIRERRAKRNISGKSINTERLAPQPKKWLIDELGKFTNETYEISNNLMERVPTLQIRDFILNINSAVSAKYHDNRDTDLSDMSMKSEDLDINLIHIINIKRQETSIVCDEQTNMKAVIPYSFDIEIERR